MSGLVPIFYTRRFTTGCLAGAAQKCVRHVPRSKLHSEIHRLRRAETTGAEMPSKLGRHRFTVHNVSEQPCPV